eukprot:981071-Pyramimonas_sp.AAC.1
MLTYGSVSRAAYLAAEEKTTDKTQIENVKATLARGLVLDEYDAELPDDCVEHFRDFFNTFHGGVGITFLEIIEQVDTVDSEWKVFAQAHGIALGKQGRGEDGCAAKLSEFLEKHYNDVFETREVFEAAR